MRPRSVPWYRMAPILLLTGTMSCSNVQPADVVGTWVMTDASRSRLPAEHQKATARLVLDAGGDFVATELPGLFAAHERGAGTVDSGRGIWKFVTIGGEQQLMLEFRQRTNTTGTTPFGRPLLVARGELYYFIGGPDIGLRMALQKQ